MTKKYELTCVFDPQAGDSGYEALVEKYEGRLKSSGAEIAALDRWGLRKLAYSSVGFKRRQQGYFALFQFTVESELIEELEQALKLDDSVLRYLVVAVPGEFVRVPQLAPENVYIYTREDRGGSRFGRGRRDRDSERRGPAPATSREEGGVESPGEQAERKATGETPEPVTEPVAETDATGEQSGETG